MKSKLTAISCFVFISFAIVFSFTINGFTLGDEILNFLRLPAWSSGTVKTHYTIFYSIGMIILSIIIYLKKHNFSILIKKHKFEFGLLAIVVLLMSVILVLNTLQ